MNPQTMLLLSAAPQGRVFGLDQQTLIQIGIQLFNAAFLATVLAFILYQPVRAFLRNRTDRIKSQMDRAGEDMAKANELKIQYEQKLGDIELEQSKLLDSARKLADEKARLILDEARNEARVIREQASSDIEIERKRAEGQMKKAIIEVSAAMAGKFVAHSIDEDVQDRLFAETMAELEEATWQN